MIAGQPESISICGHTQSDFFQKELDKYLDCIINEAEHTRRKKIFLRKIFYEEIKETVHATEKKALGEARVGKGSLGRL